MTPSTERPDSTARKHASLSGSAASHGTSRALAKLFSFARAYGSFEDGVVAVVLGVSALMGFAGVILRYILHFTIWELFPVQHYTFLIAVLLGAAVASRKGLHVRIEVLDTALEKQPKRRLALRTATLVLAFLCCCLFTYLAFGFAQWAWEIKQTDTILTWFNLGIVKTLPFVMGLVSCVAFGAYFVRSYRSLRALSKQDKDNS
jgi:TRAP-type C4-dicarboxylate transport system permease small subunit